MKIFNWVHKKLHQRVLKDGFAENVEKHNDELESNDKETQAFLKQVGVDNAEALDGWRDGILTIGTFGFDPLKSFEHQNEYLVLERSEEDHDHQGHGFLRCGNDDDDDDDEHYDHNVEDDEELNPLMFTTFGHSFEDMGSNFDEIEKPADDDVILTLDGAPLTHPFVGSTKTSVDDDQPHLYHSESSDLMMKKRGQRTTLADLFQADHVHVHHHDDVGQLKVDSCKVRPEMQKKMNVRTKSGLAFAKKLLPRVKEESNPIKNLQQLMKRMLKRKIHPAELDVQKQPSALDLITTVENDASETESLSLLPTQGAICVR